MRRHAHRRYPTRLLPGLLVAALACREQTEGPTGPASPQTSPAAAALAVTYAQLSAGGRHTCGLLGDGRAYCWGNNSFGQLGNGTSASSTVPVPVSGGLRFAQISAGADHTCGVTTGQRAYCWGSNGSGRLGDGTGLDRSTPTAVAGGRRFRVVNTGYNHTCGVTTADAGFCWGSNGRGQLGSGTGGSTTPVRVARGLDWRRIAAGGHFSCGVTTGNVAYCWGSNLNGQLGDGSFSNRPKPTAVAGNLRFRDVSAGGGGFYDQQQTEIVEAHACGVTTEDRAYCWGFGDALGDGVGTQQRTPVAVAGNRRWSQVSAGFLHTCGVTKADVAFCWGSNGWGQNGNGTTSPSLSPVRVSGDITWLGVTTGVFGAHTCGRAGDQRAYCWGRNSTGQVGDGTTADRPAPVATADPT